MALNILINAVVGMVPFFGDIFVLLYKPNIRNYKILQRYAGQTSAVTGSDWLFVSILIGSTFFLIVVVTPGFALRDRQPISLVVIRDLRQRFTLDGSGCPGQSSLFAADRYRGSACNFDL